MRALEYVSARVLRWRKFDELRPEHDHEAIVEPVAATTCDLDRAIIAGRTPFSGPFDLGHECVARVLSLGSEEPGLAIGDLVVVPLHVSCGACGTCASGHPSRCTTTPRNAMYGVPVGGVWGGMFSDQLRVLYARGALVPVPAGVDPGAAASVSDGMTDAYGALLAGLATRPGQPVLIAGGLNHGLYAAALAPALGSGPVTYLDTDQRRLEIAAGYGARVVTNRHDLADEQFPVTVDTSADPARLADVLRATAPGGHCHSVGIYFGDVALPLWSMYMDAVKFTTGRPDITPHAPAVLELIRSGKVDPMPVYSQAIAFDDLPEALPGLPAKPLVLHQAAAPETAGRAAR